MARKRRFSEEPFGENNQAQIAQRGTTKRVLEEKTVLSAG